MRHPVAFALLVVGFFSSVATAQPPDEEPRQTATWESPVSPITLAGDRGFVQTEFLYWYLRRLEVPALVTTGPLGGSGAVGDPATVVLRGGGELVSRHSRYIGIRNAAAYWFGRFGLDATATLLERDSSNLTFRHNSFVLLARPYTDAATGQPRAFLVAGRDPALGELNGSVNIYSRIEMFTEDVNLAARLHRGDRAQLNLLAGARFIQMRERLDITSTSRVRPAEVVLLGVADHFQTFDKFYGGQLGLAGEVLVGRLGLSARGTLALGADDHEIRTKGDRVIHTPAGRETRPYGLYVLPSNSGNFRRTVLDFVTEWQVNATFRWSNHVRTRVGYTLLTWNNPVRPGAQIAPVNLTQVSPGGLVGPLAPTIPWRTEPFWAQGMNFGLEFIW